MRALRDGVRRYRSRTALQGRAAEPATGTSHSSVALTSWSAPPEISTADAPYGLRPIRGAAREAASATEGPARGLPKDIR